MVAVASETWFTDATLKDRDTAWATDLANLVAVLGEPAELLVDEASKGGMGARVIDAELRGLLPKLDAAMRDSPGPELTFAAPPLMLLRGRRSILLDLTEAFDDEEITVTSLVGLGGEGKSSILRTWIDGHVAATSEPVTVFWWAFDGNASIDDFFRSLLSHFVDHASLPKELVEAVQSKGSRAEIAVHLLTRSPVILVLDGLEAVVGRGTLGRLPDDLRTLVRAVAANDVGSHCFVGSRVPIADLADLEPHDIVKVLPLRDRDALDLLADQGVQGPADARERIVRSMGNHALSVVVAGGLIAARYEGDAARFTGLEELDEVDGATEAGARFERLFSEYDQILSDAERAVLTLLAAQRRPMPQVAFDKIAQGAGSSGSVLHPLASLSRTQYLATVARLSSLGLVATDGENQTYSCHPIVRDHFMRALEDAGVARQRAFYRAVGAGYLKCVSSTTLSAVGLGVAGIAAGVLVRAGGAIGASMRVAADGVRADPNVMDGVYFMYRYANPTKPEVEADADTT